MSRYLTALAFAAALALAGGYHAVHAQVNTPSSVQRISPSSGVMTPPILAGTAILGKMGIDQTTPGTTNKVDIGTNGTVAVGTALPAGTALIGKAGIDQTTDGTTNAVSITSTTIDDYETVAASQTAQAMGATGATGDYLTGCTVIPASTSPGVVTILDNATEVVAFPGGASSLSNLVPFWLNVGAKSVSGAWKVTTGANIKVTCFGKFT